MNTEKYWQKGQTIIETALVIILLFIFFFGIAEIARAWWLKNQLNNAVRVGVRVAVVTSDIKDETVIYPATGSTENQPVFTAIWNSITSGALQNSDTKATLDVDENSNGISELNSGDTITVTVVGNFNSVVPNLSSLSFGLIPNNITLTTDASMRYE